MKPSICPYDTSVVVAERNATQASGLWNPQSSTPVSVLAYVVTVFLSSVLLFQIQPIIAKYILPWFGGAASVWTTCMLFFQVVLLLGYMYAHWIVSRFPVKWQLIVHLSVISASLLALPIVPDPRWRLGSGATPLFGMTLVLLTSVGAPYFILSTTTPLVQAWVACTSKTALPYRLFAISNVASLIGLLAYPVAVEPLVRTRTQLLGWSVGYGLFVVAVLAAAARVWQHARAGECSTAGPVTRAGRIGVARWVHWIALPACGSALLLSVTNYLSQDVAPVPFLWILPLGCYLATFILCFGSERWYRPVLFRWALLPAFVAMAVVGQTQLRFHMICVIPAAAGALLFGCLFCHGELARLKPEPYNLTSFYFALAGNARISVESRDPRVTHSTMPSAA